MYWIILKSVDIDDIDDIDDIFFNLLDEESRSECKGQQLCMNDVEYVSR